MEKIVVWPQSLLHNLLFNIHSPVLTAVSQSLMELDQYYVDFLCRVQNREMHVLLMFNSGWVKWSNIRGGDFNQLIFTSFIFNPISFIVFAIQTFIIKSII